MARTRSSVGSLVAVLIAALIGVAALFALGRGASGKPSLVVYCAHDSIYSDAILRDFEQKSGIPVSIRFDTEATKSLGLVNLLLREKAHPRCDVFWNNELLGTMDLDRAGVLHPYKGPGYERIPSAFKHPEGHWAGFGARMRVYIVNTDKMPATEAAIEERLAGDLSRMAIAKPLYGTTRTHYTVLWNLWGGDELKRWHADTRARGLNETSGNAVNKNLVVEGVCDFGWTDTDDFFVAKDENQPVDLLPIRVGERKTICIPNTVAIIRGSDNLKEAQQLVDFLLSAETEVALAKSGSRQIPVGPVDDSLLPPEINQLREWAVDGYNLSSLADASAACLEWLKAEYLE